MKSRRGARCAHDGKTTFRTWDRASRAAKGLPVPGRVYWCQAGGGYHITHIDASEYGRRRSGGYEGEPDRMAARQDRSHRGGAMSQAYTDGTYADSTPGVGPVPSAKTELAASRGGVPTSDADGDNGLPDVARYEGPDVPTQEPLVNPSAGTQGPPGGGVNPMGPAVQPGDRGPASDRVVYPDTTQGNPR